MKLIKTGNETGPAAVLLPGLAADEESLAGLRDALADWQVYTVRYDGQGEGVFRSADAEAADVLALLKQAGLEHADLLYGISLGAVVGLKMLAQEPDISTRNFFDGGLFFHFNKLLRMGITSQFMDFVHQAVRLDEEGGLQLVKKHSALKQIIGTPVPAQDQLFKNMLKVLKETGDDSVKAQLEACFDFRYPALSADVQKRTVFLFADQDPAAHCRKEAAAAYPDAHILDLPGFGYGGFVAADPAGYAGLLRDFL